MLKADANYEWTASSNYVNTNWLKLAHLHIRVDTAKGEGSISKYLSIQC